MSPINLPWFILLHASGLCLMGLSFLFPRPILARGASPQPPSGHRVMLGVATLGLGLAYFSTSYMPIEQNQFLHASVPVRLILAIVSAYKAIIGRKELSNIEKKRLWGVTIWDGFGAVVLGWWLGKWNGRVPGL